MKKYKKLICAFVLVTLLLNITGCTAYIEINDLPLVLGVAVDKSDNGKYLLTVEVFKPQQTSKEKENQVRTEILQVEGLTVFDGIRDLGTKLGKRGYWTHLKVFIISKDIAKEGIAPILDHFNRSAHIRKEFPVIISDDETAYNIFYVGKKKINEPVSSFINNTMKNVDKVSKYDYVKFYELMEDMSYEGKSAVLPLFSMNSMITEKKQPIYGVAVFKKDKMVGVLNENESKTLRLLRNKEKGGLLVVQWVEDNELQKVTIEVFRSKVKLEPSHNNKELNVNIKITTKAEIAEIMNYKVDVLSSNGREKLKKETEKKIITDIEKLMFKLQHSLKSDSIGIGKKFKEKYSKAWKEYEEDWPNVFEAMRFNVSVDVKLKGTASISEQLDIKE
ncbi:Ger(x)C family spore germination protein [Desnuesiella massiliensis]|uniref:Ger(x)C family spore germination protein n=1 Tax=Desnuesiella massiliensis TaxID=1650662 RepID=UPI0006E16712|nr:Ger(x)C family spore germination protein [Desnuesiella massiliensis]